MNPRIISVSIERERSLYDELFSAMMEGRVYEGDYIMQCCEHRGNEGQMVAEFMLRDAGQVSSWPSLQDPAGRSSCYANNI